MYALGFSIPNTRKVKFDEFSIETQVENKEKTFVIRRENKKIWVNDSELILPTDAEVVHSIVFDSESFDLIDNILGAIYIDQDLGWTLLNRGTVIGRIKFYVEEFLHGLKGKDCDIDIKVSLRKIDDELEKYRQMKAVAEYKEQAIVATSEAAIEKGEIAFDTPSGGTNKRTQRVAVAKAINRKENTLLEKTLADDKKFVEWLESHNIIVKGSNGELIPVTQKLLRTFPTITNSIKLKSAESKLRLKTIRGNSCNDVEVSEQPMFFTGETVLETLNAELRTYH